MIYTIERYKGKFGIISSDGEYIECSPDEIGSILMKKIHTVQVEPDGKKKTNVIFIRDMGLIGAAILNDLRKVGYKDSTEGMQWSRKSIPGTYRYLISYEIGTWYSIEVFYGNGGSCKLYSLDNITNGISHTDMLRSKKDNENSIHCVTRVSFEIINMLTDFNNGRSSLTISSYAYSRWTQDKNVYDAVRLYPNSHSLDCDLYGCSVDEYVRNSYRGGWVYVNSDTNKTYKDGGVCLDVCSLYPYIMKTRKFPVCKPTFWVGEIPKFWQRKINEGRAMSFYHISCRFEVKKNHLPFITVPDDAIRHGILKSSKIINSKGCIDEPIELWLTGDELELFREQYDISDYKVFDGCCYQVIPNIFDTYVSKFYEMKRDCRRRGDKIGSMVAKMMQNSLSGNMSKKPTRLNAILDDAGELADVIKCDVRSKSLIPIGSCITSYARCLMVRLAQANIDRFLYCDTDSMWLIGKEPPEKIKIGDELGQMKVEHEFDEVHFYRQKVYAFKDNEGYHITYAGCPSVVSDLAESELNGSIGMCKFFEGEDPLDHLRIDHIKYDHEVSNGTYKPYVYTEYWDIDTKPHERDRKIKTKNIRRKNRNNIDENKRKKSVDKKH